MRTMLVMAGLVWPLTPARFSVLAELSAMLHSRAGIPSREALGPGPGASDPSRSIAARSSNRVSRPLSPGWINVKEPPYNAKGDGVADDTAAIQAAHDGASAGATIYIPVGTYNISGSGLVLSRAVTMWMEGGATLSCSAKVCLTVKDAKGVRIEGGTIRMLGTGAAQFGVTWSGIVSDTTVEGVTVRGTGVVEDAQQGIGSNSGPSLTNIRICNCNISSVSVGISLNADLAGSITGALVEGNQISDVVGGNAGQGYGIHHANGSGNPSYVRIIANVIDGARRHGIYQAKGIGVVIQSNVIRNHRAKLAPGDSHGVQRPAISIGRSSGVSVVNNFIEAPHDCAIDVFPAAGFPASNVTIQGNIIRNWQSFPALAVGTTAPGTDGVPTGILVEGNQFLNDVSVSGVSSSGEALRVYSAKGLTVMGNWFELLNAPRACQLIGLEGAGEGSLTTNYTDDLRFIANHGRMTGTGQRWVRMESAFLRSAARAEFIFNRIDTGGGSTFNLPEAQKNPNIYVFGQEIDGLDGRAIQSLVADPGERAWP